MKLQLDKNDFDMVSSLLPDIYPNVAFSLKVQDDNLVKLGICDVALCIVEFDLSIEEFSDMLDGLIDIEVDAFNSTDDTDFLLTTQSWQKYLKYGQLYSVLFNAKII